VSALLDFTDKRPTVGANRYGIVSAYDFTSADVPRKVIGPGDAFPRLNGSWKTSPLAQKLALQCVTTITGSTYIDLGFVASQVGWGSATNPRSILVSAYAKHGDNNGSILSMGASSGTGYFALFRNGWNEASFSYWGGPDISNFQVKADAVDSIWTMAYSYDGNGNHAITVCDRSVLGAVRGWYSTTASGSTNMAIANTNTARIGLRTNGDIAWSGAGGNGLYLLGLSNQAWSANVRKELALEPRKIFAPVQRGIWVGAVVAPGGASNAPRYFHRTQAGQA
jgi:hypothetical protein